MYTAEFCIKAGGPYEQSTTRNDVAIELWCNDHCDLLHITGDAGREVLEQLRQEVGIYECIDNGQDQVVITEECLKQGERDHVETYLSAHDCLLLPPLRYESGTKIVRVLALNPTDLSAFYRDIADDHTVTVKSKQELPTVTPESPLLSVEKLLPTLSNRQREVLHAAHVQGYYEIPRETTTTEVAKEVGIERRTAEHHLRRAEQKLTDALVEYL
jgi:predicted DNA binding protein